MFFDYILHNFCLIPDIICEGVYMPIVFILCGILITFNLFGYLKINNKVVEFFFRIIIALFLIGYISPYFSFQNVAFNIFHLISILLLISIICYFH